MRAIMPNDRSAIFWDVDGLADFRLAGVAALIGVAAAIVFVGWPDLDLAVARLFYVEPRHFLFSQSALASTLRFAFRALTWGTAAAALIGIVVALAKKRHLFGLNLLQWTFLALVLITGPGLLANTVLKDNWGRPRPLYVSEFGGPDRFTPALERSGSCARNCSFVSGEASATFALGFAIAMLFRRRRAELMAAAIVAGGFAGLIRMGEGGHFLSDVVFAGVFMAFDVALMSWLVFRVLAQRAPDEAWWHEKTLVLIADLRDKSESAVTTGRKWLQQRFRDTFRNKIGPGDPPA
jgi:lipid A 4'-phosphatase